MGESEWTSRCTRKKKKKKDKETQKPKPKPNHLAMNGSETKYSWSRYKRIYHVQVRTDESPRGLLKSTKSSSGIPTAESFHCYRALAVRHMVLFGIKV